MGVTLHFGKIKPLSMVHRDRLNSFNLSPLERQHF